MPGVLHANHAVIKPQLRPLRVPPNLRHRFTLRGTLMKYFKHLAIAAAMAGAAPVLAQQQIVKIDGSSTVFPVTEAVAEDFQKAKKQQIKVTVGISGTGGGFKKFCRNETDVSNASRPILKAEMADCAKAGIEYVELPVAFDALTVV